MRSLSFLFSLLEIKDDGNLISIHVSILTFPSSIFLLLTVFWKPRVARKGEAARAATCESNWWYIVNVFWTLCIRRTRWWVEKENTIPGNLICCFCSSIGEYFICFGFYLLDFCCFFSLLYDFVFPALQKYFLCLCPVLINEIPC